MESFSIVCSKIKWQFWYGVYKVFFVFSLHFLELNFSFFYKQCRFWIRFCNITIVSCVHVGLSQILSHLSEIRFFYLASDIQDVIISNKLCFRVCNSSLGNWPDLTLFKFLSCLPILDFTNKGYVKTYYYSLHWRHLADIFVYSSWCLQFSYY